MGKLYLSLTNAYIVVDNTASIHLTAQKTLDIKETNNYRKNGCLQETVGIVCWFLNLKLI